MLYKVPVTFIGLPLPSQRVSPRYRGCTPRRPCHSTRTTVRPTWSPEWMFNHTAHQPFHRAHREVHSDLPTALRDVIGLFDRLPGGELIDLLGIHTRQPPKEWEKTIMCSGFSPDEVSVKVSQGKVLIHARHENGTGDNVDVRELRRTIVIPPHVNVDELTGNVTDEGMLIIKAPILSVEDAEDKQKRTDDEADDKKCLSETSEDKSSCETTEVRSDDQPGAGTSEELRIDQDPENTYEMVPVESRIEKTIENKGETVTAASTEELESQKAASLGEDMSQMEVTEKVKSPQEAEKKQFQIDVDLSGCNPESVEVKLNENNLTVVAKETTNTTGHVSDKAIYMTFFIPPNVNADLLSSTLNSAGRLVITGPYMEDEQPAGKTIPVNMEQ